MLNAPRLCWTPTSTPTCDLFERRKKAYESAIEEIKNRTRMGAAGSQRIPDIASSLLSPLLGRVGTDEDKDAVAEGTSLGKSSLTEMESDLVPWMG